jgi:DNA modification methylase
MNVIPLNAVNVGDRGRKDYGNLDGLSQSLANLGSIHPIVLSSNGKDGFDLIAGGRRLAAARKLGYTELYHGSILEPGRMGFLFREEVAIDVHKEAELDENLYRLNTKWHEDVLVIADVHEIKKSKEHKWGQRQTSALLGEGYGLTKVTHAIRLAKLIRAGDEQIISCATMSDAISVLVKRKEDEALAELHRRVMPQGADMSGFLDTFSIPLGGPKKSTPVVVEQDVTGTPAVGSIPTVLSETGAPVNVPLSKMFMLGDSIEIMKTMPAACIDHVVTDIPYGTDMKNLDTMKAIVDVEAEHEVKANVSLMEPFLQQAFRLTKSGGFCVFFYDLDWHEYLQATAEVIGWKIQSWPLIAHKTSACQNNAAQYNFTKNYESAMVLRRDEKTVLRKQQAGSVWSGDFAAERSLYHNPFAKPFLLWKWVFDAIAFAGQSFLDPFCGEMSSLRAGVNCGLVPFGIEINKKHFNRGLENMKAVYALLYKSNVTFS